MSVYQDLHAAIQERGSASAQYGGGGGGGTAASRIAEQKRAQDTRDNLKKATRVLLEVTKKQEDALFKRVHLISLVGLAFDHPSQPDFEVLGDTPSLSKLIGTYACVWQKAFKCAKYWNLPTIVATQVGNGAFKPPNLSYQEFKLGVHDKVLSNLKTLYPDVKVIEPRNVFSMIYTLDQAKLDNLLFVNSWDPHSMLGNGNRIDDSLDGKFGRCSAIAVLGWPGTNLHVRYKQI